jgi:nicotinate phosphoribosyltransferase
MTTSEDEGAPVTGHRREGSLRTGALGLCTDLYELRMVESYLQRGMTAPATFSLFVRPRPLRPWYVALGVDRALELLAAFRFGPEEIAELERLGVGQAARDELAAMEVTGEVWAVEEGTILLAQEPVMEVTAPLPVAQLLETAIVNIVQYPMLIATKAARCELVAEGRRLADFGFRRAHGLEAGVEAARAAYVGGGFATSNVEAGRRFGHNAVGGTVQQFEVEVQRQPTSSRAVRTCPFQDGLPGRRDAQRPGRERRLRAPVRVLSLRVPAGITQETDSCCPLGPIIDVLTVGERLHHPTNLI